MKKDKSILECHFLRTLCAFAFFVLPFGFQRETLAQTTPSSQGRLIGLRQNSPIPEVVVVDPTTGVLTSLASYPGYCYDQNAALDGSTHRYFFLGRDRIDPTNCANGDPYLFVVDTQTGALIAQMRIEHVTNLQFDPSSRKLIALRQSSLVPEIVALEPTTGVISSLATYPGFCYGFGSAVDSLAHLYFFLGTDRLDPLNCANSVYVFVVDTRNGALISRTSISPLLNLRFDPSSRKLIGLRTSSLIPENIALDPMTGGVTSLASYPGYCFDQGSALDGSTHRFFFLGRDRVNPMNCAIGDPYLFVADTQTGALIAQMRIPNVVNLEFDSNVDFAIAAAPSNSTIAAGQSATLMVSVTPLGGFNQSVSLTCTGVPRSSTCSISPNTITLSGATASNATVTVVTTSRGLIIGSLLPLPGGLLWPMLASSVALFWLTHRERNRVWLATPAVVLLVLLCCGCGGIVSVTEPPPSRPRGTPTGTYMLTIQGTSGGLSRSTPVTLSVN